MKTVGDLKQEERRRSYKFWAIIVLILSHSRTARYDTHNSNEITLINDRSPQKENRASALT